LSPPCSRRARPRARHGRDPPAAPTSPSYLRAGLIDTLRLHLVPEIIGAGERLLDDVGDLKLEQTAVTNTDIVTHLSYRVMR
jgi:riboflavin biosynthesis pyrimidine reductase